MLAQSTNELKQIKPKLKYTYEALIPEHSEHHTYLEP